MFRPPGGWILIATTKLRIRIPKEGTSFELFGNISAGTHPGHPPTPQPEEEPAEPIPGPTHPNSGYEGSPVVLATPLNLRVRKISIERIPTGDLELALDDGD